MQTSIALQSITTHVIVCNMFKATINGEPASKANSRRMVTIAGRARFIKSKKAIDYVKPDLDESVILDCLEGYAYKNDRQVKEKHIYHGLDKENPRAEITVEPIE